MQRLALLAALTGAVVIPVTQAPSGAVVSAAAGCSTRPPGAITFAPLGRYATAPVLGSLETRGENVAHEGSTMWVMNIGSIDVVDISDPARPRTTATLPLPGEPTSVTVNGGLVAVAVPASTKTDPGSVVFFRGSIEVGRVQVGALPDMVTFTADGRLLAVANEGEPNSYGRADSVDPEGSISVINTVPFRTRGALRGDVVVTPRTIRFDDFDAGGPRADELPADVRIYGPGARVAQDLEPEYITIDDDGRTAWVSLQENNALARVDLRDAVVERIVSLGYADHSKAGFGIDASDQGGTVNIAAVPVKGMYQPDGIATYTVGDQDYVVTANEGDARDWPGINPNGQEMARAGGIADLQLIPAAAVNTQLGRLNVTNKVPATIGPNGKVTSLYAPGSRSFSIRDDAGALVFDSGDAFECITNELLPGTFNASNNNATKKNRSDDKGPEPEIVVVGEIDGRHLAFIGLERIGGVMIYDITVPDAPVFQQYVTTRDFAATDVNTTDSGPEGMAFVPAATSPTGAPMLLVGNEVSGSVVMLGLVD